jgi:hypothetical protein
MQRLTVSLLLLERKEVISTSMSASVVPPSLTEEARWPAGDPYRVASGWRGPQLGERPKVPRNGGRRGRSIVAEAERRRRAGPRLG